MVTNRHETLPSSLDAERAILGAIMLNNVAYNEAASQLKFGDFALDAHRRIFARMVDLAEASQAIDIVTLAEELRRRNELQTVGDYGYLASLLDGVPDRPSIAHYIRIVRDKALLRGIIHVAHASIARAAEQVDPADAILHETESAILTLSEQRINTGFVALEDIVNTSFGSIDALLERGRRTTGLATHFQRVDDLTGGLQPADLIVIAGRPSMGKTALAMNIAENAGVYDGKNVAVFSLEMNKESLMQRMLCSNAKVNSHRLRTGTLWRDETPRVLAALEKLVKAKIYIDDTAAITIGEMRAKARRLKQILGKLDLIIVDYLQLMSAASGSGKRYENRTQEVSALSRGLKALAKEIETPVIALSQLSRGPETRGGDHRPVLADLRESGSIEQDADLVMFVFREEVYKPDQADLHGMAELIIAKQRNGPIGTVKMTFLKDCTRFVDYAEDLSQA